MTAGRADYPIYDADNHMYETPESFTRHLPKRYRDEVRYVQVNGRTKIAVCGKISEYIPNPTFEVVAPPGAQEEYFRVGNPSGKSYRDQVGDPIPCPDYTRTPEAKLRTLDEQGVDGCLLFPTLASLLEQRMKHDVDLTHATIHAFNEWMFEDWTFNVADRIFPTPVITLPIVEKAIEELEWCLERGARVVLIRPAPVPGLRGSRSPGLPEFDPFWARVVEAGILVAMHASDSGYTDYVNDWEGNQEMLPFKPNPFRAMAQGSRPIMDAMSAMVCHGALARHPDLKIATVENGGSWVLPLLEQLAGVYKKMPHEFAEHPHESFKRNVYVNPFWEDKLAQVIETLGSDHVLFGSDFPHPEGLRDPVSFVGDLPAGLSTADAAKIMGGNLAGLLGVKTPASV